MSVMRDMHELPDVTSSLRAVPPTARPSPTPVQPVRRRLFGLVPLPEDISVIFDKDPAARNVIEVLMYQGLHAILFHRLAHALWVREVPIVPRLISQIA